MLTAKITKTHNIENHTKKIRRDLKKVPQDAIKEFVNLTPVDTGNARRNTKLNKDTIEANYPYATILDKGRHMTNRGMRGSTQAPQGMTKPFYQWLKKTIKQIIGK